MYELIIMWAPTDGSCECTERSTYPYETKEEAEAGQYNMCMAFGNQIAWSGVRKVGYCGTLYETHTVLERGAGK